eukprot:gnl/Hemi2/12118_TR4139_c0_g1_i1.p1 gnl/Hemi2/12118_TR4139_c0_g1~~gnl/Hemi2/12118_TR4139_c0_g1_i1.p1  ORF type:complete len:196 (-),score=66.27 gnl/Hemi2/12118_TR4139_c0_g1_i1:181-702(-)
MVPGGPMMLALRIVTAVCGALLVIIGVLGFFQSSLPEAILSFYCLVFGIFTLLAELRLEAIFRYLAFLSTSRGRGLAHILGGSLALGIVGTFGVVVGAITMAVGVVTFFLSFADEDDDPVLPPLPTTDPKAGYTGTPNYGSGTGGYGSGTVTPSYNSTAYTPANETTPLTGAR